MQRRCHAWRQAGCTLALVPTMGALHAGHLALIRRARRRADKVVVSVFVNPTQFGPNEDYRAYPRTLAADTKACAAAGADAVFAPAPGAMYAPDFSTWVQEESLARFLCGARRPGHFRGVCTVVLKLFMICQPHCAVFGWKDAQQALIIRRMVRDLNLPVTLVLHPIVRERDGLAMSSRNKYLSPAERMHAVALHDGLAQAKRWQRRGLSATAIRGRLERLLARVPAARVDYVTLVDEHTLADTARPRRGQKLLLALAVFFGPTRLIDNCRLTW